MGIAAHIFRIEHNKMVVHINQRDWKLSPRSCFCVDKKNTQTIFNKGEICLYIVKIICQ